jgi:hypothetical protein
MIKDIEEYEQRGKIIIKDVYGNIPILQELQIRDSFNKDLSYREVQRRAFIRSKEPWFWPVAEKWR